MNTTKKGLNTFQKFTLAVAGAVVAAAPAYATPALENDTLDGLSSAGTELGDFLGNMTGGLTKFILVMVIVVGIGAIIGSVAVAITAVVRRGFGRK